MKSAEFSRRELLAGVGAAALLSACDSVVGAAPADATAENDTTSTAPMTPITPADQYYVTSCCLAPEVDFARWNLQIWDRGVAKGSMDKQFLESVTPREKEHTLECIGGGPSFPLISNAVWTGLPILELLEKLGVTVPSDATGLKVTSLDAYTTAIPLADLQLPVWLVWKINGEPLPKDHGFPARFLVPGRYGMKNPKWVKSIEFIDTPYQGFWEKQGWSDPAPYRANAYIIGPTDKELKAGKVQVFGTAFAGRDPIAKVEVRVDNGPWQNATLTYNGGPDVWTLWTFDWQAQAGNHTVQARSTTKSGAMSDPSADGTDLLAGYNGSMQVAFTVS